MWAQLTKAPFFLCVAYHLSFKFLIGSTLFMPTGSHSRSAKYLQQYNLVIMYFKMTALALAKLQEDVFEHTEGEHSDTDKEVWRQKMILESPTFQYWDTILSMELLGLILIRSHREKKFSLYVESLKDLVPWFFSLDHHNYARWIPICIRDMESLPPSIHKEFEENGHWVIHKTTRRFSAMPIDQAHEQNNEVVKSSGGAVGLTENPSAFRRWMVSGPEQARLLKEVEEECISNMNDPEPEFHHEEGFSTQKSFK